MKNCKSINFTQAFTQGTYRGNYLFSTSFIVHYFYVPFKQRKFQLYILSILLISVQYRLQFGVKFQNL